MKITNVELIIKSTLNECSTRNIEMGLDHYFIFKFDNDDIIKLTQETYNHDCMDKWDDKTTHDHKKLIRKFYNDDGVVDWINNYRNEFAKKNLDDVTSYNWKIEKESIWKDYIIPNGLGTMDKSCMDCEYHKVIRDPDPDDWFCDDDCAVVCTLKQNDDRKEWSSYTSDINPYKCITRSCRPYRTRNETPIPSWCPKGDKPNA